MAGFDFNESLSPQIYINRLIDSTLFLQMIYTITKLGIPDLLSSGPKSCKDIATRTDSHLPSLSRLLRILSGFNILREKPDGCYGLTPVSRLLISGSPDSMQPAVLLTGDPDFFNVYGYLYHCVKTGDTPFRTVHNSGYFEFLEKYPDKAEIFDTHMKNVSSLLNKSILGTYDFSQCRTIVDIGGGEGVLLSAILKKYSGIKGILFEKKTTLKKAVQFFKLNGIQCKCIEGDFFTSVPVGGDIYILKKILHDWDDEGALKILQNCRTSMAGKGKILIIEMIMPSENRPSIARLLDIMMMILTGGMERTKEQFSELLKKAGFAIADIFPLAPEIFIIEAALL